MIISLRSTCISELPVGDCLILLPLHFYTQICGLVIINKKINAYIEDLNYESFGFLTDAKLKGDLYMLYHTLINIQKNELNMRITKWFKLTNEDIEENIMKMANARHRKNVSQRN